MSRERRIKLLTYWQKFPEALAIVVLTAVTTLVLVIVLTLATGNQAQSTRNAIRCYAAQTHEMIRDILTHAPSLIDVVDASKYPAINTDGLECELYFVTPEEELP